MKLKIFENGPIAVDVEGEVAIECGGAKETRQGPVFLCRCGLSADKPFCDGSHRKQKFEGVGAELEVG